MVTQLALPSPGSLGIDGFTDYYPFQQEAVMAILDATTPVTAISMPTGGGKSLVAVIAAVLSGKKVAILTASKGLQSQYVETFKSLGLVDVRGQASHACLIEPVPVSEARCQTGYHCPRRIECPYFAAIDAARDAAITVTNYAMWATMLDRGEGLGPVDMLICDEADTIFDSLSSIMAASFSRAEMRRLLRIDLPERDCTPDQLRRWSAQAVGAFAQQMADARRALDQAGETPPHALRVRFREMKALSAHIERLQQALADPDSWVPEWEYGRFTVYPIWPMDFVDRWLYRYREAANAPTVPVPQVVLLSATLPRFSAEGLAGERPLTYHEYPSRVPISSRKVVHIPTVDMRRSTANVPIWLGRIDQLLDQRLDRKGIIHTTSYARRDQVVAGSKFAGFGLLHSHGSHDIEQAVGEFKGALAPTVLVSPSLTRGYDFPGEACRYVIIGKVPWPAPSALVKARTERFPDYQTFVAMQVLQQEAGRAVRYVGDWSEILIIDDAWRWFWPLARKYAATWFAEAVSGSVEIYNLSVPNL